MSVPSSVNTVVKQSTNVYTVMLIMSFLFLVTATGFLYVELDRYWVKEWGPPKVYHDVVPWREVSPGGGS